MRLIYNLLHGIFFLASAPFYFLKLRRRGNWRPGFGQRFGRYSPELKESLRDGPVAWFHAVSVGESNLCARLVEALLPSLPGWKIVVSTTTTTGMGELQKRLPATVQTVYYPIDIFPAVRSAFRNLRPAAVIMVEAEIWPNLLWEAAARKVPVALVNARLSDRSARGYRRFAMLFRRFFSRFVVVGAQNAADAARLREVGCLAGAVHVIGNMKFDASVPPARPGLDVPDLLRRAGAPEDALVWVCGSTHAGEERLLAEMTLRLRARSARLFTVIVPRHFERTSRIVEELKPTGARYALRTDLDRTTHAAGSIDLLIVNTTGELFHFYQHADLVFIGKSLTAKGGQNPIEPATLALPMLFGRNMQNFRAIVSDFLRCGGAVRVADAAELEAEVSRLMEDPAERERLGNNALAVVERNRGATARTAELLLRLLND